MLGRQICAAGRFQNQGFASLEGEDCNTRGSTGLQGLRAETGDIKAQVVIFASNFYRDGPPFFSRQLAAAGQTLVSTFKRLDGKNCPALDENRLADFQSGNLFGDAKAKSNIGQLALRQLWSHVEPTDRHQGLEPTERVD